MIGGKKEQYKPKASITMSVGNKDGTFWDDIRASVSKYPNVNKDSLNEQLLEILDPETVDDLIGDCEKQSKDDLAKMKLAGDEGNWKQFGDLAHKLKGTFLAFGCEKAGMYCNLLMKLRIPEEFIKGDDDCEQALQCYTEMHEIWTISLKDTKTIIDEWKETYSNGESDYSDESEDESESDGASQEEEDDR